MMKKRGSLQRIPFQIKRGEFEERRVKMLQQKEEGKSGA